MWTEIKGHVNITSYKVIPDGTANPKQYALRIVHDTQAPGLLVQGAGRYPVQSSCNIPTIPLAIAQHVNPAPRPPSRSEQEAAQRASRLPEDGPPPRDPADRHRMNSFFVENGQEQVFENAAGKLD
ncbi:polar growth protein [Ceratobasidium sp. 423]|nr:polar growth protein [Ceratobasidium sp. 423]